MQDSADEKIRQIYKPVYFQPPRIKNIKVNAR